MSEIFTIGHSNHTTDIFLRLLKKHTIQVVVDVRSAPYSRYVPEYNKQLLQPVLKEHGFRYLFMGDSIGGKPDNPAFHDADGKIDYRKIAATKKFQDGIDRLIQGLNDGWKIALLCAEEDPRNCHRQWLIAKELELTGNVTVTHIRANGLSLRAKELLEKHPVQMDLF